MDKELLERVEKDFVMLECGYWHYWPTGNGALASWLLREIAEELDKRNEKWDKEVNEFFDKLEQKGEEQVD